MRENRHRRSSTGLRVRVATGLTVVGAVLGLLAPASAAAEPTRAPSVAAGGSVLADAPEGVAGLAFVDAEGRVMVDASLAPFWLSCRSSCRVSVHMWYIDEDRGEEFDLGTRETTFQSSPTPVGPLNLPNTGVPYTHVAVTLTSGSQTATSTRIDWRPPVPDSPIDVVVRSWSSSGGGYVSYSISVAPPPRSSLPGQVCQGSASCKWTLWRVSADGTYGALQSNKSPGHSYPVSGTLRVYPGQRLVVSLTNSYLGITEWSQVMALPESSSDTITLGVNYTLATAVLTAAAATGADALTLCAPMQEVRTPSDGFTTQAFLTCFEAFEAGGAGRAATAIGAALGTGAVALLVANAATDPTTGEPRVPRPAPVPNPIDPPGKPVPVLGDVYWTVLDRIEDSLRERVTTHQPADDNQWRTAARTCFELAATLWFGTSVHPCETQNIFFPGSDIMAAAQHKAAAIAANPAWVRLTRGNPAGVSDGWYASEPACADRSPSMQCDEFPYFSTNEGGPGSSLRLVPQPDNSREGGLLNGFYRAPQCKITAGMPFLVIPTVVDVDAPSNALAPATFWACS